MSDFNIIVCASGGGGNFQALIDSQEMSGYRIIKLITDKKCGAIERAQKADIPVTHLDRRELSKEAFWTDFSKEAGDTDLIVLAGFMPIIPPYVCEALSGRMINTHPSLLPKFGGKGMYGVKVQEAVMAAGEEFGGCSVHFVTSEIDGGAVILQESVKIIPGETPWELGGRIFKVENRLLVEAVKKMMDRKQNG